MHAIERHARGREARIQAHHPLDGSEQPHLVRDERDERAHRDRAVDHAIPADEEYRGTAERQQEAGHTAREIGKPPHSHQRSHEAVVVRAKSRDLSLLCVERDDELHALQRLYQERAYARGAISHVGHGALEPVSVSHQGPERHRQQGEAHDEQDGIERQQYDDSAHEVHDISDPCQREFRHHALDLTDVGIDAARDLAKRRTRVEAGREPLQVPKERQSHVKQDVGGHPRVPQAADDVERETRQCQSEKRRDNPEQCLGVVAEEGVIDQRPR